MNVSKKIFLAIPTTKRMDPKTFQALFNIQKNSEHEIELFIISEQPVDISRNKCVDAFLKSDCDVLWFMDDDMVPPEDVLNLIRGDFEIIAPLTFIQQQEKIIPNLFMIKEDSKVIKGNIKDIEQVDACGMGCVFMDRGVFRKLQAPYFKFGATPDHNKQILSETFFFFMQCKQEGVKVLVDTNMNCHHLKTQSLNNIFKNMALLMRGVK